MASLATFPQRRYITQLGKQRAISDEQHEQLVKWVPDLATYTGLQADRASWIIDQLKRQPFRTDFHQVVEETAVFHATPAMLSMLDRLVQARQITKPHLLEKIEEAKAPGDDQRFRVQQIIKRVQNMKEVFSGIGAGLYPPTPENPHSIVDRVSAPKADRVNGVVRQLVYVVAETEDDGIPENYIKHPGDSWCWAYRLDYTHMMRAAGTKDRITWSQANRIARENEVCLYCAEPLAKGPTLLAGVHAEHAQALAKLVVMNEDSGDTA